MTISATIRRCRCENAMVIHHARAAAEAADRLTQRIAAALDQIEDARHQLLTCLDALETTNDKRREQQSQTDNDTTTRPGM